MTNGPGDALEKSEFFTAAVVGTDKINPGSCMLCCPIRPPTLNRIEGVSIA